FAPHPELKTRPFFVAKVTQLLLDGEPIDSSESLLKVLSDAYLERERAQKLLDRDGRALLSREQITSLYCELAEEMWRQETRELDRRSVQDIAEYVVTGADF